MYEGNFDGYAIWGEILCRDSLHSFKTALCRGDDVEEVEDERSIDTVVVARGETDFDNDKRGE